MIELINRIAEGRWFKEPSPFRCALQVGHPQLCVITGQNASGKSLVRKVLQNHCAEGKIEYIHMSQCGRGQGGIVGALIYGSEVDESTGKNSVKTLLTAFKTGQQRDKPFVLMFDEPEIGCSEEVQAGMGLRIMRDFGTMPNMVGMFIVTHGRNLVKQLLPMNPTHWRMSEDAMTLDQWVNREIVPVESLEDLTTLGHERWCQVEQMLRKK